MNPEKAILRKEFPNKQLIFLFWISIKTHKRTELTLQLRPVWESTMNAVWKKSCRQLVKEQVLCLAYYVCVRWKIPRASFQLWEMHRYITRVFTKDLLKSFGRSEIPGELKHENHWTETGNWQVMSGSCGNRFILTYSVQNSVSRFINFISSYWRMQAAKSTRQWHTIIENDLSFLRMGKYESCLPQLVRRK